MTFCIQFMKNLMGKPHIPYKCDSYFVGYTFKFLKCLDFVFYTPKHTYTVPDQRFLGSDAILGKQAFKFIKDGH